MRLAINFFKSFLLLAILAIGVSAQTDAARKTEAAAPDESTVAQTPPAVPPSVRINFVSGGFMLADEAFETAEGIWYKRGNLTTFLDRSRVKSVETKPSDDSAEKPNKSTGRWQISDADRIKKFFLAKFNRPLPLSAFGQSALHTRWGLDHRNGMDVNLHPDSSEGKALIAFLRENEIPFLVFRGPIPRVATGPHIHIGNASSRRSVR
jgi:hypothetical protein